MTKQLRIRKKAVPYTEEQIPVSELAFYPENPRIYSQLASSKDHTQENILETLQSMDHVKALRSQIDRDGQVNEALFCMPISPESELHGTYKYQVLEGNRRLAAVKIDKKGALPPTKLPCNILDFSRYSEQETESLIFSLLGQFHIIGKERWQTYETAAYIYRRSRVHKVDSEEIAKEVGLTNYKVIQTLKAFQFMMEAADENTQNWSYYEAYSSSKKIQKFRDQIPDLDKHVSDLIKTEGFPRALEMRDKLPDILGNKKARETFLDKEEEHPFTAALEEAEKRGGTSNILKRLGKYRQDLVKRETRDQILKLLEQETTRGETEYHLNQIVKNINQVQKRAQRTKKG